MGKREWNEKDHPRHDENGRFRDKAGGGDWAGKISDAIQSSRTSEDDERSYRRLRGSDIALLARAAREGKVKHHSLSSTYSFARQRALVDPGYLRAAEDGSGWEITDKGRRVVARARARDDYNREIVDEARATEFENRAEGESDEELVAQIRITETLRQQGRTKEWDEAVDHLRGMLTISYMDDGDLPAAPRR